VGFWPLLGDKSGQNLYTQKPIFVRQKLFLYTQKMAKNGYFGLKTAIFGLNNFCQTKIWPNGHFFFLLIAKKKY
jgi:hypothetical protein